MVTVGPLSSFRTQPQGQRRLALIVAVTLGLSRLAAAQTGVTTVLGAIDGTVSDETGAAIPGVTLTLTSPALIVQQMTAVSAIDGRYRFTDLPVGTYRLQAEIQGFQTSVRENLQLTAGFVARVDVLLKVGSVSETIVVSAAPSADGGREPVAGGRGAGARRPVPGGGRAFPGCPSRA